MRLTPAVAAEVLYPKDTIVLCYACGIPLYRLQTSLFLGEPLARTCWKYAPVSVADIVELVSRSDIEPGVRARIKAIPANDLVAHCQRIPTLKPGDFMDCAACKQSFSYAETRPTTDGPSSFADRGYSVQLATIPPAGKARPILHSRQLQ